MRVTMIHGILCIASVCFHSSDSICPAAERRITQSSDIAKIFSEMLPGDDLVLADGTWNNKQIRLHAISQKKQPITLRAETPGKVIFTGSSQIQISGRYVIVKDLVFKDLSNREEVLTLRTGLDQAAEECQVTNCVFDNRNARRSVSESTFVAVYGSKNKIDHCYFSGKQNPGADMTISAADGDVENRIEQNHFGPRAPIANQRTASIRIGTAADARQKPKATILENLFEECDGSPGVIVCHSSDNVIRGNTFSKCAGGVLLRHGENCLVDGNYFLGNPTKTQWGVHVTGADQFVISNYFSGLQSESADATVALYNGALNAPANSYEAVRDATIAFNTFIDCQYALAIGKSVTKDAASPPANTLIANNIFFCQAEPVHESVKQKPGKWINNLEAKGPAELKFEQDEHQIWRPVIGSKALNKAALRITEVRYDFDGDLRGRRKDIGCDEFSSKQQSRLKNIKNTGPEWLTDR